MKMSYKVRIIVIFIVINITLSSQFVKETDEIFTATQYGRIRGRIAFSRQAKRFSSFRGIPYAKPPVGKLRFMPPERPDPWKGILDAREDAAACAQKNYLFANPKFEGSEDCLYANVYSPSIGLESRQKHNLLPVMVFIHWGGFLAGYGSSNYLGPEYFMDKNNVLVTFNYRVGVLGFLSSFDDSAPGNYGLKDQVLALKWVKENIIHFGGNANKITIFGQSAGGASTHYHLISPMSKGLFHQAISESGTALALWAKPFTSENVNIVQIQAKFVGCGNENMKNTSQMIECLRNIDVDTLINSGDNFKFFSIDPLTVYSPVIETLTSYNPHPFITKHPLEYIRAREFMNIPWIVGVVAEEGLIRVAALATQSKTRFHLNSKLDELMPDMVGLRLSSKEEKISKLWSKIKNFYFRSHKSINLTHFDIIRGFTNLYTDRFFHYSTLQAVLLHSIQGHKPIWFYNFNYKGQFSYEKHFSGTNETIEYEFGVSHCDELLYLFKSTALFPELTNENDAKLSKIMLNLWTNFAHHGDPTPSLNLEMNKKWLELDNFNYLPRIIKDINFFNISGSYNVNNSISLSMQNGFYNRRVKFWEELFLAENIEELKQNHIEL